MAHPLTPDPSLGVFETMLVADAKPVELAAHLQRLQSSLEHLYGATLPDEARQLAVEHARGLDIGRLRVTASPSRDETAVALQAAASAIDIAVVCPPWTVGSDLRTRTVAEWRGGHKWADRRLLEALDADTSPAAALLAGEDDTLLETTRANLFVVRRDGVVVTPPTDGRILPGVARMRAMETARRCGIEVVETAVTRADVASAREAFVTGSVRGVEPVRSIDGSAVGHPEPSLADTIAAGVRQRWLGER